MTRPTRSRPSRSEPILGVTAVQWGAWLADHHASATGALVMITKGAGRPALSYAEALDIALAWGWIDGQKRAHDERAWLQRFSPRRPRSAWSKINRDKAEALIRAGKMRPPGLKEVERAKQDGRWDAAYDSARTSQVPDDLARALAGSKAAAAFFETLDGANRYAILYRVQTAKKPETRAARIAKFVTMLANHETLHPARRKRAGARGPSPRAPGARPGRRT
ncbi:MAG TPA: YdeI/OmpD-associated family protein [Kofleriaceae bacterium]|jgi:uncharacterized protein YdeI (YjbR/CyaY-like superfamily)|nr:YdeI/OmpD-associated family protein [Kofleriaceae bacterium]